MTDSSSADGTVEAAIARAGMVLDDVLDECGVSEETMRESVMREHMRPYLQAVADTASRTATAAAEVYRDAMQFAEAFACKCGEAKTLGRDQCSYHAKKSRTDLPERLAALTGQGEGA